MCHKEGADVKAFWLTVFAHSQRDQTAIHDEVFINSPAYASTIPLSLSPSSEAERMPCCFPGVPVAFFAHPKQSCCLVLRCSSCVSALPRTFLGRWCAQRRSNMPQLPLALPAQLALHPVPFSSALLPNCLHLHARLPPNAAEYMPPEVLKAEGATCSYKTDVYSFGVIVWELVTGRMPWQK
jgi:hypothetical protein